MRHRFAVICLLGLTILLVGCGGNGLPGVGGTITNGQVAATLVSVTTLPRGSGNTDPNWTGPQEQYPRAGYAFVVTHLRFQNSANASLTFDGSDCTVHSGKGEVIQQYFNIPLEVPYTGNNLLAVEAVISSDSTMEGDLIFEAPLGDNGANLVCSLSGATYTWNMGL